MENHYAYAHRHEGEEIFRTLSATRFPLSFPLSSNTEARETLSVSRAERASQPVFSTTEPTRRCARAVQTRHGSVRRGREPLARPPPPGS